MREIYVKYLSLKQFYSYTRIIFDFFFSAINRI